LTYVYKVFTALKMLLSIPYQALEIGNIHLTPFQADKYGKAIARMSYKDNSLEFQDVSILTPPLKVVDYNPENSRLRIDLSEQFNFQVKLNTLQEYLVSTFYVHQQSFLGQKNETHDNIRQLFHFLLNGSALSLYIFPTSLIKKTDGSMVKVSELQPNDTIRCVIRLQGISQVRGKYGISLRLQHSIPSLWLIPNEISPQ
jgi:hypothetical protein